jgi:hypothetical protein
VTLTDQQVELIRAAAALVPTPARGQFLRSISNRLNDLPVTDRDVHDAITLVLSCRGISYSTQMTYCDSASAPRPRITRWRPNK